MKNTITILLVALLLCGCVKVETTDSNALSEKQNKDELISVNNEEDYDSSISKVDFEGKTGIPFEGTSSYIRCSIPAFDGLKFYNGFSQGLFKRENDGAFIVAMTCDGTKKTNESDLLKDFSDVVIRDVSNYITSDGIEYKQVEKEKTNNLVVLHFVGIMQEKNETANNYGTDLFVTGYVFAQDDTTVGVWGTVYDKDQPQETIDFVNETVDFMMKSITIEPIE